MELTTEGIHCKVFGAIKSKISKEGWVRLFGNLWESLKEGIDGIQEVDQIGRYEFTETWRQALVGRSGLLFWIPFQIIDAVGDAEVEKKSP